MWVRMVGRFVNGEKLSGSNLFTQKWEMNEDDSDRCH